MGEGKSFVPPRNPAGRPKKTICPPLKPSKPRAKTLNPIVKSPRNSREKLKSKPNDDLAREELTMLILQGQYNARTLFNLSQKYQAGITWIRSRANEAFSLIRILQATSEDPDEAKAQIKSDIDQKLDKVYELSLSLSRPDLRTALSVLTNKAKLHNIYNPEQIELINNPMLKISQIEIQHIKETGQLPQSILNDWNNKQVNENNDEEKSIIGSGYTDNIISD